MLRVCLGNGRDGVASHEVKKGVERFEAKDWKSGLDTLGLRTVTSQCSAEQLLDGPSGTPAWPWPRLLPAGAPRHALGPAACESPHWCWQSSRWAWKSLGSADLV